MLEEFKFGGDEWSEVMTSWKIHIPEEAASLPRAPDVPASAESS